MAFVPNNLHRLTAFSLFSNIIPAY